MTYSLTEKEEVLLEQKLEELFTLTELDPNEYIKEPALKKVKYKGKDVTRQQADWLKQADKTSHWTDMYKWVEPEPAHPAGKVDTPEPSHDPTALVTNPNYNPDADKYPSTAAFVAPAGAQVGKKILFPKRDHHPPITKKPGGGKIKPGPGDGKIKSDDGKIKPDDGRIKPIVPKKSNIDAKLAGKLTPSALQTKKAFMDSEEAKTKRKELKKAELDNQKKARAARKEAEILQKKIETEADLEQKKKLELERQKQLKDLNATELELEEQRIKKEAQLRKTAEIKAQLQQIANDEANIQKNDGTAKEKAALKKKETKLLARLSKEQLLAIKTGATDIEIRNATLDFDGNLRYQPESQPKIVKTSPVEISKEKLSTAQKNVLNAKQAMDKAKVKVDKLIQGGASADEIRLANKELTLASKEFSALEKQQKFLQGSNNSVNQNAKIQTGIERFEQQIMKTESQLQIAKTNNDAKRIPVLSNKLEDLKIEQKIMLDAQTKLKKAELKNVQSLTIKIQKNDTLGKIAKKYGVTVKELAKINKIKNPNLIIAGKDLTIPVKGADALLPGTKFSKSQIDNLLTRKQQNLIKQGETVWIDKEGNIRSSAKINDPNAINLSDPPKSNLALPTDPDSKITPTPDDPSKTKIKSMGIIPDAEAKRLGWSQGAELKINTKGQPMLQLPGGTPRFISNAEATKILSAMGKSSSDIKSLVLRTTKKGLTTAGAMIRGAGRLSTGAVLGFGIKGEIISTIALTSAMLYGSSRMLRNIDAEQKRIEGEIGENALSKLSPAQYLGGYGNMGRYHDATQDQMGGAGKKDTEGIWSSNKMIAELLSHDDVITRTLENTTDKNLVDLKQSFMDMTEEDVDVYRRSLSKDGKINEQFLKDNIVTIMDVGGVLRRVNPWGLGEPGESGQDDWHNNPGVTGQGIQGKDKMTPLQMLDLILQPGVVIQIIPTHTYSQQGPNNVRVELSKDERTTKMKTVRLDGENTNEFTDIQHYVSDKVERGGRIVVDGEEKYIPTKDELKIFLNTFTEDAIPEDWYLGFKDETIYDKMSDEQRKEYDSGMFGSVRGKRPTTPEGWIRKGSGTMQTRPKYWSHTHVQGMTDQEKITWWKEYRKKHKISPQKDLLPVGKDEWKGEIGGTNYFDEFSDWLGNATGWWKPGAATDPYSKLTYLGREDLEGKLSDEAINRIYHADGTLRSDVSAADLVKIKRPPPEGIDTTLKFGPVYRWVDGKKVAGISEDEDEIANFVSSKQTQWNRSGSQGSLGYPKDQYNYNLLMTDLSTKYAELAGVSPNEFKKLLRTLAHTESGMKIINGSFNKGKYRGDTHLGKEGSFGVFHVRWGYYKPGAVNDFNKSHGTNHSWKEIAGNPYLSAEIGAWYYAKLLKQHTNPAAAYGAYNGGPEWLKNENARTNSKTFGSNLETYYMNESVQHIRKSAILEGIAKAA